MEPDGRPSSDTGFDVFISYSRKDRVFAEALERELRGYRPPRDLPVPQRYLRIFRDEQDFAGPEYHRSLARSLQAAASLIVVCSPNATSSKYVAEEIELFTQYHGSDRIIPVLLDGIPNNEAGEADAAQRAFPEPLVRLLPIPLAADFRGFDAKRHRVRKAFAPAWFKTLADVYAAYDVDREKIEQRERRRTTQRVRNFALVGCTVAIVVVGLAILALRSRSEASVQERNATARRYASEAGGAFDGSAEGVIKAALLSVASVRSARTSEGESVLQRVAALLPKAPLWSRMLRDPEAGTPSRRHALTFSPDGMSLASADPRAARLVNSRSGELFDPLPIQRPPTQFAAVAFSPDGRYLVVNCLTDACVIDVATGRQVARLVPTGARRGMMWTAVFSPDGRKLATASYGSTEVSLYDVPNWSAAGTLAIERASSGVFALAFSPDGTWLSVGAPSLVEIWRVGRFDKPAARSDLSGVVWSIAFRHDGASLVVAGSTLQEWNIKGGDDGAPRLDKAGSTAIVAHTVLPARWGDDECVAVATNEGVHVLCGTSFEEVMRIPVASAAATVSTDGRLLATEGADGTLALWPLESGTERNRVTVGSAVSAMAVAQQDGWLAAGTEGGDVVLLALDSWREQRRLRVPSPIKTLDINAGGGLLAVAAGTELHVFDTRGWQELKSIVFAGPIRWAHFDALGRYVIVLTETRVVVVDPQGWSEVLSVDHDATVESVSVNENDGRLAMSSTWSAGHDSGVHLRRVFDLQTRHELGWQYSSGGGTISKDAMKQRASDANRALEGGDSNLVGESESWNLLAATGTETGRTSHQFVSAAVPDTLSFPMPDPRWLVAAADRGTVVVRPIRAEDIADHVCARLTHMVTRAVVEKLVKDTGAQRSCLTP